MQKTLLNILYLIFATFLFQVCWLGNVIILEKRSQITGEAGTPFFYWTSKEKKRENILMLLS